MRNYAAPVRERAKQLVLSGLDRALAARGLEGADAALARAEVIDGGRAALRAARGRRRVTGALEVRGHAAGARGAAAAAGRPRRPRRGDRRAGGVRDQSRDGARPVAAAAHRPARPARRARLRRRRARARRGRRRGGARRRRPGRRAPRPPRVRGHRPRGLGRAGARGRRRAGRPRSPTSP